MHAGAIKLPIVVALTRKADIKLKAIFKSPSYVRSMAIETYPRSNFCLLSCPTINACVYNNRLVLKCGDLYFFFFYKVIRKQNILNTFFLLNQTTYFFKMTNITILIFLYHIKYKQTVNCLPVLKFIYGGLL